MSIPKRTSKPGTYFVTSGTAQRRSVFQVNRHAELLIETLQHYRHAGNYKLHAFVIMPDHIHLLLTPQGITLERAMGLVKGGFSRRLDTAHSPWQRGFSDHRIRDKDDYLKHLEYIQQNPVRARLVANAEEYPYSSAFVRQQNRTSAAEAAMNL